MTMLHDMAEGNSFKYKSDKTKPLLESLTRWWHRKRTRKAAEEALFEVTVLRQRLYECATEVNEWRLKVGGAAYSAKGTAFMSTVDRGIRNISGPPIRLTDDDFYPRD